MSNSLKMLLDRVMSKLLKYLSFNNRPMDHFKQRPPYGFVPSLPPLPYKVMCMFSVEFCFLLLYLPSGQFCLGIVSSKSIH